MASRPVSRRALLHSLALGGAAVLSAACGQANLSTTGTSSQAPTTSSAASTAGTTSPGASGSSGATASAVATTSGAAASATSAAASASATSVGSAGSASASPTSAAASAPRAGTVTLRFLSWRPVAMDQFAPIWQDYQAKNKIQLDVDKSGDYEQTKLDTGLAADSAPDLWDGRTDTLPKTYNAGAALQLDKYLQQDKINLKQDYALTEVEIWRQKTFGVPYWAEPFGIYYNKSLFQQKGVPDPWTRSDNPGEWTMEEMLEAARKISEPDNDVWGLDWGWADLHAIGTLIWGLGVSHLQYDPKFQVQLTIPESIQAHRDVLDWNTKMDINAQGTSAKAAESRKRLQGNKPGIATSGGTNLFALGKIGIHYRSVNDWRRMWPLIKDAFQWDILPVPSQGGKPGGSWIAGHPVNAWAKTKHPDETWGFMRWMIGDEFQNYLADNRFLVPAKLSVQPKFFQPTAQYPYQHPQVFVNVFKRPHGVIWSHFNSVKNQDDYGKQVGKIYGGQLTVEAGLADVNTRMNADIDYGGGDNPFAGLRWPFQSGA